LSFDFPNVNLPKFSVNFINKPLKDLDICMFRVNTINKLLKDLDMFHHFPNKQIRLRRPRFRMHFDFKKPLLFIE